LVVLLAYVHIYVFLVSNLVGLPAVCFFRLLHQFVLFESVVFCCIVFAFCCLGLLSWSLQIRLHCCASFGFERWGWSLLVLPGLSLSDGFSVCRFCAAEWLFVLASIHTKAAIFGATVL
jgi:hypothetical protein